MRLTLQRVWHWRVEILLAVFAPMVLHALLPLPPPVAREFEVSGAVSNVRQGRGSISFRVGEHSFSSSAMTPDQDEVYGAIVEGRHVVVLGAKIGSLGEYHQLLQVVRDGEPQLGRSKRLGFFWLRSSFLLSLVLMLVGVIAYLDLKHRMSLSRLIDLRRGRS